MKQKVLQIKKTEIIIIIKDKECRQPPGDIPNGQLPTGQSVNLKIIL